MSTTTKDRRWYQEPMVLMVLAIPLTSVIVGLSLLTVSIQTWDGTVVDDYYRQGKEINRLLARDHQAFVLRLEADLNHEASTWTLNLKGDAVDALSDAVTLRFVHPTRSGHDMELTLVKSDSGRYQGQGPSPQTGQWSVHLETPRWRLHGRATLPATQITLLPRHDNAT